MPNCPRLEAFTCTRVDMDGFPLQHHVQKYPNVKKLVSTSITQPLEENDIIGLLERFPSLQLLSLPHCQYSTPLSLMPQYCRYLDSLTYSSQTGVLEAMRYPRTDNAIGLHSVYVTAGENYHLGDIASLLASHCDTLTTIVLAGKMNHQSSSSRSSSTMLSQDAHFKHLNHLFFYPDDDDGGNVLLQWILKGAPNAREIEMAKCNVDNDAVYHTMKKMTNLESLSFALPSTAIISGLEYHASTLRHRSNLRSLSIDVHFSGNECPRAWRAVARLSNLRELFMQLRGATLDQEFVAFIEALAHGCPELRELILEAPMEFPTAIISKFPLYPKLQELTLGSPNFWNESLLPILQCPSLEALYVEREQMSEKVAEALAYLTGDAWLSH